MASAMALRTYGGAVIKLAPNKSLHLTAIPLHYTAAGKLGRYT